MLRVGDLEQSRAFYEETLGLYRDGGLAPGEKEAERGSDLRFRLGESTRLALRATSDTSSGVESRAGLDHVALRVDTEEELHELVLRLQGAGVETDGVRPVPLGQVVSFRDPDGTRLECFHQSAARACELAAFVLPIQDGRVLLAKMSYGPGLWGMTGGMVEPGEAIDAGARREVLEETGLEVTTDQLVAVADRGSLMFFVFVGRVVGGELVAQEAEIAELRWFDASELAALGAEAFGLSASLGVKALAADALRGFDLDYAMFPDGSSFPVFSALRPGMMSATPTE